MSILSQAIRKISAPVARVASFVPTPLGQGLAVGAGIIAQDTAKREFKRSQEQERAKFMEFMGSTGSTFRDPYASQLQLNQQTQAPSSGFFGTLRSGIQEVGGLVSDIFSTGLPQLFGQKRPTSVIQQPAVTTVTNQGAQESQGSGSIQAGMGSLLPSVLGGARSLLKSPAGQLALGTGVGGALSMFSGDGKQMRVTRKMKSQARTILNMTGGNLSAAADILGIDENTLVMILLKRFRNDGPVVTKAALRKTKQTIRRLHSMQDVLKSITPTAAGRRRAPMKRATTTTLIKN